MVKEKYDGWSNKELIKELQQLKNQKKYGIVWETKPEDVVEKCKQELPILEEDKNKGDSNR